MSVVHSSCGIPYLAPILIRTWQPPGLRSAEAVRIFGGYLSWEPGLLECDASPNMIIID